MKVYDYRAVSTLASAIVVVFVIAIIGLGIFLALNNPNASISTTSSIVSTTHVTSCSGTCETTFINSSSTSSTQISYATSYSVASVNSGGGCSLSNVTAFSSLSLKVLSVGVNCAPKIYYGTSYNTNNQSVFNFNMTVKNTGNKTLYFQGLFSTPYLSVNYQNTGLIQQEGNRAPCTITSAKISFPPNSTAQFVDPTCQSQYFYYPTKSGSVEVGLTLVANSGSSPIVLVNATLTFS